MLHEGVLQLFFTTGQDLPYTTEYIFAIYIFAQIMKTSGKNELVVLGVHRFIGSK